MRVKYAFLGSYVRCIIFMIFENSSTSLHCCSGILLMLVFLLLLLLLAPASPSVLLFLLLLLLLCYLLDRFAAVVSLSLSDWDSGCHG